MILNLNFSASVRGVQNSYMQFGWIKDRFSNDFRTVPELKHFGIGLDFVSELKDSHDFAFKVLLFSACTIYI